MKLTITPDLSEQGGGYAFLDVEDLRLPPEVKVAVQDVYAGAWIGPPSRNDGGDPGRRQPERHDFGPYPVETTALGQRIRIGPEIVNPLTDASYVEFTLGKVALGAHWPDDVLPRLEAPGAGGLRGASESEGDLRGHITPPPPPPPPEPEPELEPEPPPPPPEPEPEPEPEPPPPGPGGKPRWLLLAGLLALLVLLGLGYVLFWPKAEPAPEPDPVPLPVVETLCTPEALGALEGGFAALEAQIDACAGDVTADTAFDLLDQAQRSRDARALEIMGTLYDSEAIEPVFKGRLGISLQNNPAVAARYYSEARETGATGAAVRLQGVCTRLAAMTGTAEQGAYNDYCR